MTSDVKLVEQTQAYVALDLKEKEPSQDVTADLEEVKPTQDACLIDLRR